MSDNQVFRLKIIDSDETKSWSFNYNFETTTNSQQIESFAQDLLKLSADWLDYCLTTLKLSPRLAFAGNAMVNQIIKKRLTPELQDISVSHEISDRTENGQTIYSYIFDRQDIPLVTNKLKDIFRMERASEALSRSQLSSIISEFEFFVLRLMKLTSKYEPSQFLNNDDTIKLGELIGKNSIEIVISERIEKKLKDEMRGSHDSIIRWVASTMDMGDLSTVLKSKFYIDFMEACQRRHILAHNGGVVNETYIEKCLSFGVDAKTLPKLGESIRIDPSYLKRISGRCFLLGLFLLHIKVQKLGENERLASLENLLGVSHDFLLARQTKMCIRVLDFAEQQKKTIPTNFKLFFGINRALAELYDPNKGRDQQLQSAKNILEKYDWSVTTPTLDLALACVNRDFENILELARKANLAGLDYVSASTFVVFTEARKVDGFMDCFPRKPLEISFSPSE